MKTSVLYALMGMSVTEATPDALESADFQLIQQLVNLEARQDELDHQYEME